MRGGALNDDGQEPPAGTGGGRLEDLRRDYRVAILRYLSSRDESALAVAYERGRAALAGGVGILEVVHLHHEILAEAVLDVAPEELPGVVAAAGDVLGEVLAWAELTRRALGPDVSPSGEDGDDASRSG